MAIWTVSTSEKKSVEEREIWIKDDVTITRINGYRWGKFTVETSDDEAPDGINPENPDGINMYDYFGDNADNGAELDYLDDGWFGDWEFPDDMPEEERERIMEGWEEESYEFMENDGWSNDETECWFYGPLDIDRIGDSEPSANTPESACSSEKKQWPN